jgi:hypothetical protein
MAVTAEFITATIFAVIMVLIGLGAIWIVRWQTYFLLRHQGKSPHVGPLTTAAPFLFMLVHSSLPGHDFERGSRPLQPIVAEGDSVELAATSPTSDKFSRESVPTTIDTQPTTTDGLSCLSDTTVMDETWHETRPVIATTEGSFPPCLGEDSPRGQPQRDLEGHEGENVAQT